MVKSFSVFSKSGLLRLSFPWLGDKSIVGYIGHSVFKPAQDNLDIDKSNQCFQWFATGNMETHKVNACKRSENNKYKLKPFVPT